MKKILVLLFTLSIFWSCEDIGEGFISDFIRLKEDTISVTKGLYVVTSAPILDGSTKPLKFEIISIKDADGNDAGDFTQDSPVRLWYKPYNPDTDVTMEIVSSKLFEQKLPAVSIGPVSGVLGFNSGTRNLKEGVYTIDVRVSSSKGSKLINNYAVVKLESRPWEIKATFGEYFKAVTTSKEVLDVRTNSSIDVGPIAENLNPNFSIQKVGDAEEVYIKLTFLDANNQPFHGEAISVYRNDQAKVYNNWFDNSLKTDTLTDGLLFSFPTVPFPTFGRVYTSGNQIALSYYTLNSNHYTLTPEALAFAREFALTNGHTFESYILQTKTSYQINEYGRWEVKVKFTNALKK